MFPDALFAAGTSLNFVARFVPSNPTDFETITATSARVTLSLTPYFFAEDIMPYVNASVPKNIFQLNVSPWRRYMIMDPSKNNKDRK